MDVKKLRNVPDGGGWRFVGRQQGDRYRRATRDRTGITKAYYDGKVGRRSYIPCSTTTPGSPTPRSTTTRPRQPPNRCSATRWPGSPRAAWSLQRVISDNGGAYRSQLWRDPCAELGILAKRTRPYRPQTSGKRERFRRTLAQGWAFKKLHTSESARRATLPACIHQYNHHRSHTAIGKASPITSWTPNYRPDGGPAAAPVTAASLVGYPDDHGSHRRAPSAPTVPGVATGRAVTGAAATSFVEATAM